MGSLFRKDITEGANSRNIFKIEMATKNMLGCQSEMEIEQADIDCLETVVKNAIPILNSPILALLAVPAGKLPLEENDTKQNIIKEEMKNCVSKDYGAVFEQIKEAEDETCYSNRNSTECCKSTRTPEINERERGNTCAEKVSAEHTEVSIGKFKQNRKTEEKDSKGSQEDYDNTTEEYHEDMEEMKCLSSADNIEQKPNRAEPENVSIKMKS